MVAAGLGLVLAAWLLSRPTAPALAGTNPADVAVLSEPPSAVELVFTAAPDLSRSHVSVRDGAGAAVSAGAPQPAGADRLRLPISRSAAGPLTVTYHITFGDSRELIGELHFGVGAAPNAAPAEAHEHDVDPIGAALLVIDGLVGLTVVGLLLFRRPARRRVHSEGGSPS